LEVNPEQGNDKESI